MTIEIKVPVLPESVAEATLLNWHLKEGDTVAQDINLLDLETDKVVLEVPAPIAGRVVKLLKQPGDVVKSGEVLGLLEEGATTSAVSDKGISPKEATASAEPMPAAGPSARREATVRDLSLESIQGTGKGGRITRDDILQQSSSSKSSGPVIIPPPFVDPEHKRGDEYKTAERKPMSSMRRKIAERLVAVQQTAAILTTYNEVNLHKIMDLRTKYKEAFEKKHGVRLGFMSLFVKAVVEALKRFPVVNASIDKQDIIYHYNYDISIAVSTERGLVTPVVRAADQLSLAEVERAISNYGQKARDGKITLEELTGGTFTITNGGVFGSLLSSPIINPPQSAILGMHKIEERPVVEDGQIVIRPMMYLALSYDHRIIDGKDSVGFLVAIKNLLEDPMRLLFEI